MPLEFNSKSQTFVFLSTMKIVSYLYTSNDISSIKSMILLHVLPAKKITNQKVKYVVPVIVVRDKSWDEKSVNVNLVK